jgi:hypothetical protein
MTERQIVNWLLGFVIGILTVLAWQRVMNEPLLQSDSEATRGPKNSSASTSVVPKMH